MNANRLPDHVLQWVINTVDSNASVGAVYELKGSTSSTLHSISLIVQQSVRHYVVRQLDNSEWLAEEPDLAEHEAASLQMVERIGVGAPELIAYDAAGNVCGVPVVLMTKLEGTVVLKPNHMKQWLHGLAETLANIHRVDANDFSYDYFPYNDSHSFDVPVWTDVPETWKKALDLVNSMKPAQKECLIHRDYHPANVLWNGGAVSGVVDWVNACKGPREIDIGHCRVNLAMLYGTDTADAFLKAYQHYVRLHYHRYWDIIALINFLDGPPEVYHGWEAFGVTGLTNHLMKERLDELISHVTSSQTLRL